MISLDGTSVLVVDDDPDNVDLLSFAIGQVGGTVRSAKDGLVAIATLGAWLPDILLIDLSMPRMDGYELLATIRIDRRLRHIPAIAVTAHAFDIDRERCLEAGFAEHVTKPVDVTELLALIETLTAVPQSTARLITPPSAPVPSELTKVKRRG
jgi:CheY-like chemotaxis protein